MDDLPLAVLAAVDMGDAQGERLERDVDPDTVRELATNVEPYLWMDGTKVCSLMLLERQLRPKA